jgi:hypothetical protein
MTTLRVMAAVPEVEFERRLQKRQSVEGLIGCRSPRRKVSRLLDDLRASLPWFEVEDRLRLLRIASAELEESDKT